MIIVDGYWLDSPIEMESFVWKVLYDGNVGYANYYSTYFGIRPIVYLLSSIPAELIDGVWTVTQ